MKVLILTLFSFIMTACQLPGATVGQINDRTAQICEVKDGWYAALIVATADGESALRAQGKAAYAALGEICTGGPVTAQNAPVRAAEAYAALVRATKAARG